MPECSGRAAAAAAVAARYGARFSRARFDADLRAAAAGFASRLRLRGSFAGFSAASSLFAAATALPGALPSPPYPSTCRSPLRSTRRRACSTRLRFVSLLFLKSVSYQPLPFKRNCGADTSRFSCDLPQSGHLRSGASRHLLQGFEVVPASTAAILVDRHRVLGSAPHAACSLTPFTNPSVSPSATTRMTSPGPKSPRRIRCASGFSNCCWIARFSGRAP